MVSLDEEFDFYQSNKERFLSEYEGKFVVFKEKKVIGVYENRMEAIKETRKEHELGTFLVQEVKKDDVLTFHSRVILGSKQNAT